MENTSMPLSRESMLTRKGCSAAFCQLEYSQKLNFIAHEWTERADGDTQPD